MPADALLETNLLCRALDVNAIDRIWPVRLRTVHGNACVNPIVGPVVNRLRLPKPKCPRQLRVQRNWLLRSSGFWRPNSLLHNRAPDVNDTFLEIHILPFES